MTNEIWKDIAGYEGLYQVSNLGRVKSLPREKWNGKAFHFTNEKIMTPVPNRDGYLNVCLIKDRFNKQFRIHRLVAEAFISNPKNKPCVDHINTIRNDNRVENLRWVTVKENMNNSLTKKKISEVFTGENHPLYGKKHSEEAKKKMSEAKSIDVVCVTTGVEFSSAKEAGEYYGCCASDITKCCKNKKNYAGKYNGQKLIWKYLN